MQESPFRMLIVDTHKIFFMIAMSEFESFYQCSMSHQTVLDMRKTLKQKTFQ